MEVSLISFFRGLFIFAVLIAVPGIAIGWNRLPNIVLPPAPETKKEILPNENHTDIAVAENVQEIVPPQETVFVNPEVQQVAWQKEAPQLDFSVLEKHLKILGVRSFKLEKWGSKGELFRFSCLVASADNLYEKQFQTIGADEKSVMQKVIADIEAWKQYPQQAY